MTFEEWYFTKYNKEYMGEQDDTWLTQQIREAYRAGQNAGPVEDAQAKLLHVQVQPRYWEDAKVNLIEDSLGDMIPMRKGDVWDIKIDVNTGTILNWPRGTIAEIHYKVCDAGVYTLYGGAGHVILEREGYVPRCVSPGGEGYGDYVIMFVDGNGVIENWEFNINDF